jgi:hypothetical protein
MASKITARIFSLFQIERIIDKSRKLFTGAIFRQGAHNITLASLEGRTEYWMRAIRAKPRLLDE